MSRSTNVCSLSAPYSHRKCRIRAPLGVPAPVLLLVSCPSKRPWHPGHAVEPGGAPGQVGSGRVRVQSSARTHTPDLAITDRARQPTPSPQDGPSATGLASSSTPVAPTRTPSPSPAAASQPDDSSTTLAAAPTPTPPPPPAPPRHPMVTHAQHGIHLPNKRYAHAAITPPSLPPTSVRAAMRDPEWGMAAHYGARICHTARQ